MKNRLNISPDWLSDVLRKEDNITSTPRDLESIEQALIQFAQLHAAAPPLSMRDKILNNIQRLNEQKADRSIISLENVPLLTPDANWLDWAEAVKAINPPEDFEDIHLHTIRNDDVAEINIAWVKQEVPEEVHHDILESFILLEGTCECHITDLDGSLRIVKMREGDYISFKLGEVHDIHITSREPAKAILQWLKIAA